MMFKLLTTTLMLAHAHAQSGTVTGDPCSCAIQSVAAGVCPASTTAAAQKRNNANILWQDAEGNKRPPTEGGCCQVASSFNSKPGSDNECSNVGFKCKPYTEGAATMSNPLSCTKEGDGSYLCVCATKEEFAKAVSAAMGQALIGAVVGGLCAVFAFVYAWHWYFCGTNYDSCCSKDNKGNGCFWACCNFRKHCFGHGAFVKTCLYYIFCCPCRMTYCGCYGREKLLEKDKTVCCAPGPGSRKEANDAQAVAGAPEALDMVA